jgi:peptidoglycan/LPS O-acetylase OafA/YrhL
MKNEIRFFFKNPFGLGLFRIMLAISVLIGHSSLIFGTNIGNGVIAVKSFYIISCFLMALILTKKYHTYDNFLINRFLRLYPTYIFLFLTVLVVHFYPVDVLKHLNVIRSLNFHFDSVIFASLAGVFLHLIPLSSSYTNPLCSLQKLKCVQ